MKRKLSLSVLSLLALFLLSVVPVGITAGYLVGNTRRELENTARQTVDFYISQFSSRTESILQSLKDNLFILTTDKEIKRAMQDGSRDSLGNVEENAARIITGTGWQQESVTGIFIFKNENSYISVLREGMYSGGARRAQTVYSEFHGANSARQVLYSESNPGYCYLVANYIDLTVMEVLGKIIIEIDASSFLQDHYLEQMYAGALPVLTDLQGNVLSGTEPSALTAAAAKGGLPSADFVKVAASRYYHVGQRLGNYNLRIDVFVPENEIFATIQHTTRLYMLVTIGVLLLTVAAAVTAYTLLTRPLRQMVKTIDAVASGKLDEQMPPTPYRETESITTAFNSMTQHLKELFEEVYQSGMYLREAEYKLLEAQINPHFIFNVLEVINMRAMAAGQPEICKMVSQLAHLLRSNISNRSQQKLTFRQELEYVEFYLQLQQQRFENNLLYNIRLEDENLRNLYLPKLTIQPVVENSVVHGLENKRGGGSVSIHIWEEENSVYVRIKDDGVGFDTEQLWLDAPPAQEGAHNHVALANIHRRIQLLYGSEYGLQVSSAPGRGSEVTLVLPVDNEPDAKGMKAF